MASRGAHLSQLGAGFDTALSGHVDIEQCGIVFNDPAELDGFFSAGGFPDIEAKA